MFITTSGPMFDVYGYIFVWETFASSMLSRTDRRVDLGGGRINMQSHEIYKYVCLFQNISNTETLPECDFLFYISLYMFFIKQKHCSDRINMCNSVIFNVTLNNRIISTNDNITFEKYIYYNQCSR